MAAGKRLACRKTREECGRAGTLALCSMTEGCTACAVMNMRWAEVGYALRHKVPTNPGDLVENAGSRPGTRFWASADLGASELGRAQNSYPSPRRKAFASNLSRRLGAAVMPGRGALGAEILIRRLSIPAGYISLTRPSCSSPLSPASDQTWTSAQADRPRAAEAKEKGSITFNGKKLDPRVIRPGLEQRGGHDGCNFGYYLAFNRASRSSRFNSLDYGCILEDAAAALHTP